MAGTMMSTVSIPIDGSAMKGRAVSIPPLVAAPAIRKMPAATIIAVTMFCTTAAVRMPT